MAVVALRLDQGVIREARVALGGVASTPVLAPAAMQLVTGAMPSDALLADAGAAARAGVNPDGDIHGSAEYRRDLVQAMVRRALRDALAA
jgi:CO/xanthine dehydrogenase FAD-binding subunit